MNDIEILEDYVELCKKTGMDKERALAIENLLKRNEELEYKYEKALDDLVKSEKERQEDKEKIKDSLPKKFLIELINKNKINISGFECIATEDLWKWVTSLFR